MKFSYYIYLLGLIQGLLILNINLLNAQKPTFPPQVHEIRLQLVQAHHVFPLNDFYNGFPASFDVVNGLSYTYHINLNDGIRLGLARRVFDLERNEAFDRFSSYTAQKTDWDISLQYMRKYHIFEFQLYGGVGAILTAGSVEEDAVLQNTLDESYINDYTYTSAGANVFGGVRYFFQPHISVSWELSAYYLRIASGMALNEISYQLLSGNETGINTSIGISLHLVKMSKKCACPKVRR